MVGISSVIEVEKTSAVERGRPLMEFVSMVE